MENRIVYQGLRLAAVSLLCAALVACASKKEESGLAEAFALSQAGLSGDARNGTVLDINGNTWMKCAVGQQYNTKQDDCTGTGSPTVYGAASMSYCTIANGCTDTGTLQANSGPVFDECNNLSLAGITGWRMPTHAEMVALIAGQSRASFLVFFPQTPDDKAFWAGDELSSGSDQAHTVSFASATMALVSASNKQNGKHYVRCIKPR